MKRITTLLFFTLTSLTIFAQVDLDITLANYSTKQPIANQKIKLTNPSIGYSSERTSNEQGQAIFTGLNIAGTYTVSTDEDANFYAQTIDGIVLTSVSNSSVTVSIVPKQVQNLKEVVVTSTSQINTRNAEVSSSLKQKEIEELPAEGRDITRLLYRLPNIVQATGFYPEAPTVSINGANSLYTNYMIDGLDNNERFLGGMKFNIPVGFARNINVLTNNFSSEYGNTANGVVNVTTRSGSNETVGEAFFVTRPGSVIDAASRYILRDLSGNQVKDGFQRFQGGFGLGGAIAKDKTFYYINAEYTRDNKDNILSSPVLGVNTTVPGSNNFTYLSGKIDHLWSDKFKSSLRANVGIVNIARQGGGLEGGVAFPSNANFQDRNSVLIASQNTYTNDNFKSETNLQYSSFRWNYGRALIENSPQVAVQDPTGQTVAVLGHPGYLFDSHENTIQFQEKLTWYLKNNTIKAGAEIISANHGLYGGGNPYGNYTVQLNAAQLATVKAKNLGANLGINDIPSDVKVLDYNVELAPAVFGKTQNIYSAYVEDAISVTNKLNISIGLRYDYDNLSKGGSTSGDYNNIAPRFSANYKLTENSSIRGGFGIFYDKVLYTIYSDALQQNTTSSDYKKEIQALVTKGILPSSTDLNLVTFDGNLSASQSNVGYLKGASASELQGQRAKAFSGERRILNPDGYQNPYTQQFSLGYQKQIDAHRLFYIDLVYNKSNNLFRLKDLNAPTYYDLAANGNKPRSQADADKTRPIPVSSDGSIIVNGEKLTGGSRAIVETVSDGEAEYWGLSFNFQKDRTPDDDFGFRFIYTLSRLRNNTEDVNFRAEQSNDLTREWGPSINDRTHVINTVVSYYPVKNLTLTLAALIQSGQPINRIPDATVYGTTDLYGYGVSFSDAYTGTPTRSPGETRNSDRLPWSNTFDLSAAYKIPTTGKQRIELRADVFNLLNAENYSGYFNNATQSNQVQVGPISSGLFVRRNAAPPRQFQFSLRYAF